MSGSTWSDAIAESVLKAVMVPLIAQYAGEDCANLRQCIREHIDIIEVYKQDGAEATGYSYDFVASLAHKFPAFADHITVPNVMRWLNEWRRQDIISVINSEPGGQEWFYELLATIRRELFGRY